MQLSGSLAVAQPKSVTNMNIQTQAQSDVAVNDQAVNY